MTSVLYVYAIVRDAVTPEAEAVDGSRRFGTTGGDGVFAVFTPVDTEAFSQEAIDSRAGDLEWLGAIGYRHQAVVSALMKMTALVPLRAFTMFSGEDALRAYLREQRESLASALLRLDGKQEWTLRIEFVPEKWSEAIAGRVAALRDMQAEIASASSGKAFLLRKKLDDEKKRAFHLAEQNVVAEIEQKVTETLRCETVAESRMRREGAFPQINVLIGRDEEVLLQELRDELTAHYEREGVVLALLGPWPPYTFATLQDER